MMGVEKIKHVPFIIGFLAFLTRCSYQLTNKVRFAIARYYHYAITTVAFFKNYFMCLIHVYIFKNLFNI
uniref:Uncharacterized protein n=1 Tax=Octopus bimaculoides TaxID=37653 RepID=A0A0L8HVH0_OCTBM